MIDVRIGEEDAGDGRAAWLARMQRREALDLRSDIGRTVEQKPALAGCADREPGLRALYAAPRAGRRTVVARAVPLRHAAAGGRTEHADDHARRYTGSAPDVASRSAAILA